MSPGEIPRPAVSPAEEARLLPLLFFPSHYPLPPPLSLSLHNAHDYSRKVGRWEEALPFNLEEKKEGIMSGKDLKAN